MKKIICFFLVTLTMFALVVPASAATEIEVAPCYDQISSIYAWISIDDTLGIVTCVGEVNAKKVTPVKVTVQLQQLKDGVWHTLATWTNTGSYYATKSGNYCVAKGYTYRVKVTGYIYDSDGNILESASGTDQLTY